MLVFIGSLILVLIAAFIQMTDWMLVGAIIKPNLLFVVLIVLATANPSWPKRLVLILTAAFAVKISPGLVLPNLIFTATALASILLLDILPWQRTINVLVVVAAGTLAMNFQNFTLLPVVSELALNLFLAFVLVNIIQATNVPQIKLQRHRF